MRNEAGYKRDIDIAAEWLTDENNVVDQGDFDTSLYRMADVIAVDYDIPSCDAVDDILAAITER